MESFLQNTKSSFDKAAELYDSNNSGNAILAWMRDIVHSVYLRELKTSDKILELNSGTGTDALFLAKKGMKVYATDISENMINIFRKKIDEENAGDYVTAEVIPFDKIGGIKNTGFDAVISNFGGLNCIKDFGLLEKDVSEKLKPGGLFIAVVMNKYCPWEIFYYLLKFDIKSAFRRFKENGIDAKLDGEKAKTFYFSPLQYRKYFSEYFKLNKIYSLGLFTPPPFLLGIYDKLKPLVKIFMKIDDLIKGAPIFNLFGDHFIIILKKKNYG